MTKKQSDHYRIILEKKAEDVRRGLSAHKAAHVITRQDIPSDEGDLSQQSHEEWLFLNRNTIDVKLLREVEDALRRLRVGEYGTCLHCEEPISIKRLDALPWAKYCVVCQEAIASRSLEAFYEDDLQESRR